MVSEQLTSAYNIFRVIETISGSRVFKATTSILPILYLTFDGNDKLWDNRKHLSTALLEHVEDALHREEPVGVLLLADALKEDRQVVVVIELLDLYLPVNAVLGAVFNGYGQVTSVVEAAELRGWDLPVVEGTSSWLLGCGFLLGLI